MKKVLSVVLLVILMFSFAGCSIDFDGVKGTYKEGDGGAIIIEDDTVTYVDDANTVFFNWEKSGDYIHLTLKNGNDTFKEHTLKIVDGGVLYHYKNIKTDHEFYTFYEKVK